MPANPYMDDNNSRLAMLLMSLGSGMGQAGAAGRPFYEGFAPAAGMFGNALAQSQQMGMQRQQQQEVADLRKRQFALQESEFADKKSERDRQTQVAMGYVPPGASTPGMGVPPSIPTMGPQQAGLDLYNYFTKEKALGPAQAAAVVGNFAQESGFNPAATHDGGTGHGLGGWRLDRRDALQNYAKLRGGNVNDTKLQADFFLDEIKTRPEYKQFSAAQTPQEASTALMHYFRPAGYTPNTPEAGHGYANRVGHANAYAGPQLPPSPQRPIGNMIAQGSSEGGAVAMPPPSPPMVPRPALPPEDAERIRRAVQTRQITPQQGDAEANRIITDAHNRAQSQADAVWKQQNDQYRFDRSEATKSDQWYTLGQDDVKMYPGLDTSKAHQRNRRTGEIKPVGGSLVNIDQKGQTEFAKEMGKIDAKRFGEIMTAESTMSDMASKLSFALDQFGQTYTGPGAETANAFFKTLGTFGSEDMAKKASAADAAQAVISQMKPHMRASGSGASSDRDMDMFAKALPSLLNTPDGNQRINAYFQRLSDRATQVRQLAQEHSQGGKIPLTDTGFDDAVKKLGPLFSKDELAEMQAAGKTKAEPPAPPPGFKLVTPGGMSPMPNTPPPPAGFRVMTR